MMDMMDSVWRVAVIALIAAAFAALLKKTSPDLALLLPIAFCVVVLYRFAEYASRSAAAVKSEIEALGLSSAYFLPLFKITAVAVISKVCADICRDADESAIGSTVETVGAFAAIVLSAPLFTAAWELLQELL